MSSDKIKVSQTPLFGRKVKKLKSDAKKTLDQQVHDLIINPESGSLKRGDLAGIRVHKYRYNKQEILLAYTYGDNELLLINIGGHENFYRDLKDYID